MDKKLKKNDSSRLESVCKIANRFEISLGNLKPTPNRLAI